MPACKKTGVINLIGSVNSTSYGKTDNKVSTDLNHWFGSVPLSSKPEKPHTSSSGQKRVTGLSVLFMHATSESGERSLTSFMQGGNRAPRLISALEEGPSIGLTTG
jgi:hypothetical protein